MTDLLILFSTMALLTVTPGPNNLLLASSGVQFGLRRSVPTLLGIVLGFPFLCLCVGLGLGPVFQAFPLVQTVLKFVGAGYLLYLAWRVATTRTMAQGKDVTEPIGFLKMAGFQWVNPKTWSMAITATTTYMSSESTDIRGAFIVAALMIVTTALFNTPWLVTGALLRDWLSQGQRILWFNRFMGIALAGFVVVLLLTS